MYTFITLNASLTLTIIITQVWICKIARHKSKGDAHHFYTSKTKRQASWKEMREHTRKTMAKLRNKERMEKRKDLYSKLLCFIRSFFFVVDGHTMWSFFIIIVIIRQGTHHPPPQRVQELKKAYQSNVYLYTYTKYIHMLIHTHTQEHTYIHVCYAWMHTYITWQHIQAQVYIYI